MDIVRSAKKRNLFFAISGIILAIGIFSLIFWGLNFGIDFAGGTLLELKFNNTVTRDKIGETLDTLDFAKGSIVQSTGEDTLLIKSKPLDQEQINKLKSVINEKVGEYSEIRLESVWPTVGKDTINKAIWAVVLASIFIILYIAYAFYKIPKPANSWRFGVSAVLALIHDVIISIGIYAIFCHFFGYEVNALFITAILTIMGFSVHDTIVVFDRIRENLKKFPSKNFTQNANDSVIQTLARSLNTSLTLILVLLALLFLGGESIRPFIALLLVGVSIGTYSSIFTATPILVVWQEHAEKRNKVVS